MRACASTRARLDCVPVAATDPLYILYTSGTTGRPKGVVRDNGGHMVALKWSMQNLYGVEPGEVCWAASDVGWVVGHSYIVYAPLLHGCTSILYEGKPVGTPDAGAFWRVIAEHGVARLVHRADRVPRHQEGRPARQAIDPQHDLSKFRTLFLAGERADPPTLDWAEELLKVPVIDHWWQTETGWAIAGNPVGLGLLPVKHGSADVPMPGYDVRVLGRRGGRDEAGDKMGSIVVKLPLPPGCLPTLWQADDALQASLSRRISRATIRPPMPASRTRTATSSSWAAPTTSSTSPAIGSRPADGGGAGRASRRRRMRRARHQGRAQGRSAVRLHRAQIRRQPAAEEIEQEAVALVRERSARSPLSKALVVARLPKTRSGKILRGTMKKIADGEPWPMPATIDDPAVLSEIEQVLARSGYGRATVVRAAETA